MVGIFEAGGTKTEVRFGDLHKETIVVGKGINPYLQSDHQIKERLVEIFESIPDLTLLKLSDITGQVVPMRGRQIVFQEF
jgi:hypothetical protein